MERLSRFIKAVYNWIRSGCATNSRIAHDRMTICLVCPEFDRGVCSDCGCVLRLKTKMLSENCPQNKW